MKILITGGKGFVGRHFVNKLNTEKNNITVIDKLDGIDCREFFRKATDDNFDLVIHLAAIVGGRELIDGNPLAVADNLSIDSEFFQWCLIARPKKVVYFSSAAVYPTHLQNNPLIRLKEKDVNVNYLRGTPDMTYGWSKLTGEFLSQFLNNVYVFRPFSGYGADQDLSYPFSSYIARAMQKKSSFEVWGSGTQTRDFIHIEDIVEAVLTALETTSLGPINLGWGRPTSFIELAQMCMKEVGYVGQIVTNTLKPVGCMHRVADPTKMLSFYNPKVTLEEGIARAIGGKIYE